MTEGHRLTTKKGWKPKRFAKSAVSEAKNVKAWVSAKANSVLKGAKSKKKSDEKISRLLDIALWADKRIKYADEREYVMYPTILKWLWKLPLTWPR